MVVAWCHIVLDLIGASLAPKTKHMYESAWRVSFNSPTAMEGFNTEDVLRFLRRKRECGKSLQLVRRQLLSIAFFAGLKGVRDPTKDPRMRRAILGWECMTLPKENVRKLIDVARLAHIVVLHQVCKSPYEVSLFRFTYLLTFFGACRISELMAPFKAGQGTGIELADVILSDS
ncbi:hypothetical protein NDU88_004293 [Pleurodeles waltl]|uniref:Core-binding (CB) domain-containing protein n=1 Tax=Pleurodeles waltl TaxID=8319 RepID=A0AAV7RKK5_PLEWA|nr:hypothetical protein NDU88_004293 [Pleurodeles waltl]